MKQWLAMVLCAVLLCVLGGCTAEPQENTLFITELQSAGDGNDWIELYNSGNRPVSLQGYYLSDNPDSPGRSALPAVTLPAGEYLVVTTGETLNFGLKAAGETIILSDPTGKTVQTVDVPHSVHGLSYGCVDGDVTRFAWYAAPTPNASNDGGMLLGSNATNEAFGVRINEAVCRNKASLYDRDGDYGDWVELYNTADTAVDLSRWQLTDSEDVDNRWYFPEGTVLQPNAYLVVFCDKKDRIDGELHTNFRLNGDFVSLYTANGEFCSGITCDTSEQDVAFGCDENGATVRCLYPTPWQKNATAKEAVQ